MLEIFIPLLTPGANRTYLRTSAGKVIKTKEAKDWEKDAALIIGTEAGVTDWKKTNEYYGLEIIWWGGRHDRDAHTKLVQDTITEKLGFDDRWITEGSAKRLDSPPVDYAHEPVGMIIKLYPIPED